MFNKFYYFSKFKLSNSFIFSLIVFFSLYAVLKGIFLAFLHFVLQVIKMKFNNCSSDQNSQRLDSNQGYLRQDSTSNVVSSNSLGHTLSLYTIFNCSIFLFTFLYFCVDEGRFNNCSSDKIAESQFQNGDHLGRTVTIVTNSIWYCKSCQLQLSSYFRTIICPRYLFLPIFFKFICKLPFVISMIQIYVNHITLKTK